MACGSSIQRNVQGSKHRSTRNSCSSRASPAAANLCIDSCVIISQPRARCERFVVYLNNLRRSISLVRRIPLCSQAPMLSQPPLLAISLVPNEPSSRSSKSSQTNPCVKDCLFCFSFFNPTEAAGVGSGTTSYTCLLSSVRSRRRRRKRSLFRRSARRQGWAAPLRKFALMLLPPSSPPSKEHCSRVTRTGVQVSASLGT